MIEFKFATVEESKTVLLAEDEYLKKLTGQEMALKMGSSITVKSKLNFNKDKFYTWLEECIMSWEKDEKVIVEKALKTIRERLSTLRLLFTQPILMIKTNGKEEWNSAYTRANAIILPERKINSYQEDKLEKLLIHEVFHIISRTYPGVRNILYGLIGFYKIDELVLPQDINSIKLTNPDAPNYNYFTSVYFNDKKIAVVPIIVLQKGLNNVDNRRDILKSISTKLLVIAKKDNMWKTVNEKNQSILLELDQVKGLKEKLDYDLTHFQGPEEHLADTFTRLVSGEETKPSKLIKRMKKVLF